MGFLSMIGNLFSAIGRGIVVVAKGIILGIAKIFTREWTVIDSQTYAPITNKEKILNDSRGPTPLDLPPVPAVPMIPQNVEDVNRQRSVDFLKNLYRINPEVVNNPKYYNYDVNMDPYHGYGMTFGPMFNPDLINRRYDMFGRPIDDVPIYNPSIMQNHPPMTNLNPFASPVGYGYYPNSGYFSNHQNHEVNINPPVVDSYTRNGNNYHQMIEANLYDSNDDGLSDISRGYRELQEDKERAMWSDQYIEDLDKYIWEDDHGYSRLTPDSIDRDVARRRRELESGDEPRYIPENYVGNARLVYDI